MAPKACTFIYFVTHFVVIIGITGAVAAASIAELIWTWYAFALANLSLSDKYCFYNCVYEPRSKTEMRIKRIIDDEFSFVHNKQKSTTNNNDEYEINNRRTY